MTIDQRLDRLTERHEALAQSLELFTVDLRSLHAAVEANTSHIRALTDAMTKLTNVVASHEQRIQRLEP
jgi:hypothetical protein